MTAPTHASRQPFLARPISLLLGRLLRRLGAVAAIDPCQGKGEADRHRLQAVVTAEISWTREWDSVTDCAFGPVALRPVRRTAPLPIGGLLVGGVSLDRVEVRIADQSFDQ